MLPTKTSITRFSLTILCTAVLAACGGGGGSSPNTGSTPTPRPGTANNGSPNYDSTEYMLGVIAQIRELPEADQLINSDAKAVEQVWSNYQKLPTDSENLVPDASKTKLKADIEALAKNQAAAKAIQSSILALPASAEINTEQEKSDVVSARNTYNQLTDAQKTWMDKAALTKLAAIEANIKRDTALGAEFNKAVAALPADADLTKADTAAVVQQDKNYVGFTPAQKSYVSDASLKALEQRQQTIAKNEALAKGITTQVIALPQDPYVKEANLVKIRAAYEALTENQQTWLSDADKAAIQSWILDDKSLEALNLPEPLHTSFISSSGAQQHNPHMQLRKVDNEAALVDTQIGLIRTLAANPNNPVMIDAVAFTNTGDSGATQVEYATPHSAIAKASSTATSNVDISEIIGERSGALYSPVQASMDAELKSLYGESKASAARIIALANARAEAQSSYNEAITDAEKFAAQLVLDKANSDLQKGHEENDKIEARYLSLFAQRNALESATQNVINNIAYIKKDQNGLVFDKAFDGIYVMQFADGTQVVLHDPAAAGWTYQTFAHYIDPKNGIVHGYQSIGDETPRTSVPTNGTATYAGLTTAYLVANGQNQQLTADVKAVADFAKKGLRFTTSNSQTHTLNNGVRVSVKDDGLNLKGNATWAASSNSFKGAVATTNNTMKGSLNGKFFGASAAEIGGTYGLKNAANDKQLIGGYGAKRQ